MIEIALESAKLNDIERAVIKARLKQFAWNKRHTAQSLGVSIKTVYNRIKAHKLKENE